MNVKAYDATGTEEEMKEKNADIVCPNLTGDGKYKVLRDSILIWVLTLLM